VTPRQKPNQLVNRGGNNCIARIRVLQAFRKQLHGRPLLLLVAVAKLSTSLPIADNIITMAAFSLEPQNIGDNVRNRNHVGDSRGVPLSISFNRCCRCANLAARDRSTTRNRGRRPGPMDHNVGSSLLRNGRTRHPPAGANAFCVGW